MTPGEFERLSTLLDEALSQPEAAREAFWSTNFLDMMGSAATALR